MDLYAALRKAQIHTHAYRLDITQTYTQVVSSGEPLSMHLYAALRKALPQSCTLLNLYGELPEALMLKLHCLHAD
jgi:hypothetical protein